MSSVKPQQLFFDHIKASLPAHLSLVDEVAELLNISNDSAYRRIRGEKPIGLDEIQKLCDHYKVSLDQLLHINANTTIFCGNKVDSSSFNLNDYLQDTLHHLTTIKSLTHKKLYYFNKDIPIFHFMQFPELYAFKCFFWKRTLLGYPDLVKQQFIGQETDNNILEIGKKIINAYTQIPSTEIWSDDSIHITIRQIEFYRQTNIFSNKHVVLKVYSQLEELINHIELQAETGIKFLYNESVSTNAAQNNIYINECLIGDNSIYIKSEEKQRTIINHGGLSYMYTEDKNFCDYTYNNLQNIMRKSTLITAVGEKERSIFFNALREKIYEKKKNIV